MVHQEKSVSLSAYHEKELVFKTVFFVNTRRHSPVLYETEQLVHKTNYLEWHEYFAILLDFLNESIVHDDSVSVSHANHPSSFP